MHEAMHDAMHDDVHTTWHAVRYLAAHGWSERVRRRSGRVDERATCRFQGGRILGLKPRAGGARGAA